MKAKVVFFLIAFCSLTMLSQGQTVLNPGDLVILGVDAKLGGSPDEISFTCFKDITTGTEIQITDQGYERCYAGLWGSGEGGAKLTRTGGTILAGTVITFRTVQSAAPWISFTFPDTLWSVADLGSGAPANFFDLNNTGDQVYFAQGGTWTTGPACSNQYPGPGGRMLFAFSTTGIWAADGSTLQSNLYPGMSCYSMAPTSASNFVKYTGPLTIATQKDWIARINTVTNWTKYTTSALYLAATPNLHNTIIPITPGTDADWTMPNPDTLCQNAASINLNSLISGLGLPGGTWSGTGVTGNTFSPLGLSGTFNITYTNDCPCCISQTHSITVNPSPSVAVPANITVCNNTTVPATNFLNTPAGGSYSWTNSNTAIGLATSGSGNIGSFTATNTTSSPITATITVTPVSACPGIPSTYNITVNPTPTVTVPSNIYVCNGGIVNAVIFSSIPSGGTFTWINSNTAIGLAAAATGNIGSFSATNTGTSPISATITVTPTVNNCSGTPAAYNITVYPTPVVTVPSNITVCNGATVAATSFSSTTSGATFAWTNNNTAIGLLANGSGDIGSFTATNTGSSSITATITVTPTANGCTGTPSSYNITVNPTPTVTVPSNIDVCSGGTVAATSFASTPSGGTFTWTNNTTSIGLAASGSGDIGSFSAINTGTSPITATITVTPTFNNCTGTPATYNITVNPMPAVSVPANITVCNGETVTPGSFSSTISGATLAWTNNNTAIGLAANGSGDIGGFTAINSGSSSIIATISVTPSANACTGTPSSFTITVNPTDNPAFNYTPSSLCKSGSDVTANITGGATGIFSASPSGLVFLDNTSGLIDLSASLENTYTITFITSGCSATSNVTVHITAPQTADFSYTGTYCQSDANPLPVLDSGATAGTFSASPAGLAFVNTFTGEVNLVSSTPGTYTVTNTIAASGGCAQTSANSTLTINPTPYATASSNSIICEGQTLHLTASGGSLYHWSGPNSFSSTTQNPDLTNTVLSEAGTYTVTATNNSGCTATAQTTVAISVNPTALASSNSAICAGQTLDLSSFGTIQYTYNWSGPNNFTSMFQNPHIPNATTAASGIYSVTVTNNLGCSDTANVSVTIYALPTVLLSGLANTYCIDASPVTLIGTPAGGVLSGTGVTGSSFIPSQAGVGGPYQLIYSYTDANTCFNSDTVMVSVNALPLVVLHCNPSSQIYTGEVVTLTASPANYSHYNFYVGSNSVQSGISNIYQSVSFVNGDNVIVIATESGCSSSDTLLLDVKAFPNAFTPDGNGDDDVFLKGLDLQIINRWGQQIYSGTEGWNGMYKSQKASPGTYYYIVTLIDLDKSQKILTGSVNLIDTH